MVREIAGFMVEREPFGTLRSAGAKRDADNPFTLESDWDVAHILPYRRNDRN